MGLSWITIPNYGRARSAVTVSPGNLAAQPLTQNSPHLSYTFTLFDDTDITLESYLAPTYNFKRGEGLKFAVAIDDEPPQTLNLHDVTGIWGERVSNHIAIEKSEHKGLLAGEHTLKVWLIDSGIVFQKFVIDTGGLKTPAIKSEGAFRSPVTNLGGVKPSYLGPPESRRLN